MRKSIIAIAAAALLCSFNASAQFGARVVSPEIGETTVTFRVSAPNAQKVSFSGSWMGFGENGVMTKDEKGLWSITIPKPAPEMYQYSFNIDGTQFADPNNFNQTRDGSGYRSVLFIRGKETEAYDYKSSTQHGMLQKVWFDSKAFGETRRLSVYLPYGYETSGKDYPVLYLQHGGGGDEESWPVLGRACEIMDYMIERGLCEPMIVVMPNCMPWGPAAPETQLAEKWVENMGDEDFAEGYSHCASIHEDLIPFVESHYRVIGDKAHRAIAGLSMGGVYTLNETRDRPDLFDYIGVLSMGTTPQESAIEHLSPVKKAGYKYYFVGCGKTDIAWGNAERLMAGLDELKMDYTWYSEVGGHSWDTWRKCLLEFAPKLFK